MEKYLHCIGVLSGSEKTLICAWFNSSIPNLVWWHNEVYHLCQFCDRILTESGLWSSVFHPSRSTKSIPHAPILHCSLISILTSSSDLSQWSLVLKKSSCSSIRGSPQNLSRISCIFNHCFFVFFFVFFLHFVEGPFRIAIHFNQYLIYAKWYKLLLCG